MRACVFVLDGRLAGFLFPSKTGGSPPFALSPFPPLITAYWASAIFFQRIHQARNDKRKHLWGDPPHSGAVGGWDAAHFLSPLLSDQDCSLSCWGFFFLMLLGLIFFYFHTSAQTQFPPAHPSTGVITESGRELLRRMLCCKGVVWCFNGCCIRTCV